MQNEQKLEKIPIHFEAEYKRLLSLGIDTWQKLFSLQEEDLIRISQSSLVSSRNLKKLKGMSTFICELKFCQADAALLLHSGIGSIDALAKSTPQQIVNQTGRLARSLNLTKESLVDLRKASSWIKVAIDSRIRN